MNSLDIGQWGILLFLAWLGWKFLTRKQATPTPAPAAEPILQGDGQFNLSVAGLAHRTAVLEAAFASHISDGKAGGIEPEEGDVTEVEAAARLVPVSDNPHDPAAVEVHLAGQLVGFLPRKMAPHYRTWLKRHGHGTRACRCLARVEVPLHPDGEWEVALDLPRLKA